MKKIIKPAVSFDENTHPSPVSFGEKNRVTKAMSFFAKQRDECGILREVPVSNEELANREIASDVDASAFEKKYTQMMEDLRSNDSNVTVESKNTKPDGNIVKIAPAESETDISDLANYDLEPLNRRIYINRNGIVDYEKNEVEVNVCINENGRLTKNTLSIRFKDVDKITKVIAKKFPTAIIYNKKSSEEIENYFRRKTSKIPTIRCFTDAGWHVIDSEHVYLHKGCRRAGINVLTPLALPCCKTNSTQDLQAIWQKSLALYADSEIATVLSLYSFLGVTYKLFDEAGFAPHFLLFLTGKTGSFKTTIAKLLFTQLTDENHREFPRRIDADTIVSFERALVLAGTDTVTLIDDYAPAKTKQSASEMANKLESIVRMIGDGSTKSRSNASLEDCRGEGVKGVVALTGELQGRGLSSNLRCLYCEIEREKVNIEAVTWFQQNEDYYCTLIQHFVFFLSKKWDDIVDYIKNHFDKYRKSVEIGLDARRLIDVAVTLYVVSDIFQAFLISHCGRTEMIMSYFTHTKEEIMRVVKRSEILSTEEDPALTFMKTALNMIANDKIYVVQKKSDFISSIGCDGFWDGGYLYLLPDNTYFKVTNYLKLAGEYFGLELKKIGKLLCDEGYAISTSNGNGKHTYYARILLSGEKKVNFLKISKEVVEKLQESMEGVQ